VIVRRNRFPLGEIEMKQPHREEDSCSCCRRDFLQAAGAVAGTAALFSGGSASAEAPAEIAARKRGIATVRGAFVYPPSESLRKAGYWSWPGSSFDAEGRQKQYMARIKKIERDLGMRIAIDEKPLDDAASITGFINDVKKSKPDGLLLIPFKKGHWGHVVRIVQEAGITSVVFATWSVLFIAHVRQLYRQSGVYMINSPENLDAVAYGMKMIKTARWMKESRLLNIAGAAAKQATVPNLGTEVRTLPRERFMEAVKAIGVTPEVEQLAQAYLKNAKEVVEPGKADILDAAQAYFALKRLIDAEKADALMMQCLGGLTRPLGGQAAHIPVCMGFMSLRDEGIAAGCEADLDATLTLMLLQQLFGKPGFQHNPAVDTHANQYFGAHCTCASKMNGVDKAPEPYVLRSHNEAGWGCVPRVLMTPGKEITLAKYLTGKTPRMHIYSGKIVRVPPASGCRTNVVTTINELDDVCDVQGHHLSLVYGNYASQLRSFCQLYGIQVVT